MSEGDAASAAPVSLAGFLGARLDEDEAAAVNITVTGSGDFPIWVEGGIDFMLAERMEREVAAKRAILAAWRDNVLERTDSEITYTNGLVDGLGHAVRYLAAVYSDCEGYRDEWKPS